jgi:Protein of unknown function (DUF2490)
MKLILSAIFLLLATVCNSQTGSWSVINAKLDLSQKWTVFGEFQVRSLSFYNNFHYYELKGGASYSFKKNFTASTGVGNFDTFSEGGNFLTPKLNSEIRIWEQLSLNQFLDRFKIEHRYRAEQRFTSYGYKNRFRYRFNTTVPINNHEVKRKTFYLSFWDEIFFSDKEPYFERNRLFLGGGYEFTELFAMQAGYIRQFDYKLNDETGKNFFQISLLFEFDWQKKPGEKVPGSMN